MQKSRTWISVAVLILVLIGMYVANSVQMRPKPAPDIQYEGRLSHLNETAPKPDDGPTGAEPAEKAPEPKKEATTEKPKEAEGMSAEEQKLVEAAKGSVVKLETVKGDIYLDLYDEKTPITVGSFLDLVETGFYDGLNFHRVIGQFMIQGGCPKGDGTGGPGFTIPDEANKGLKHRRGSLSMAKTAAPNTGGSQFFVCHTPQPHLDGVHTVFGECVEGMDVVDKIQKGDKITTATILKKSPKADENIAAAKKARVAD